MVHVIRDDFDASYSTSFLINATTDIPETRKRKNLDTTFYGQNTTWTVGEKSSSASAGKISNIPM